MKIQKQYGNSGNIKYAMISKIPFDPIPHPDSNGFISAKYYKPITSYRKKQVKKIMRGLEWSAAIEPDSINRENNKIDSIYVNPYKIKYLKYHHLKTDRMLFRNKVLDLLKNKTTHVEQKYYQNHIINWHFFSKQKSKRH